MLINGIRVTHDNLQEWSIKQLNSFKATLKDNIEHQRGQYLYQNALIKLINVEIDR